MDIDLMISSFPKLINATFVTLKLLSASLLIGIFLGLFFAILRINKNPIIDTSLFEEARLYSPMAG